MAKKAKVKRAKKRAARFEVYRDRAGAWRWRCRAANGRIVPDGSQGRRRRSSALLGLRVVAEAAQRAWAVVIEDRTGG